MFKYNLSFIEWLNLREDNAPTGLIGIDLIKFLVSQNALSPSALSDWPTASEYYPFIYVQKDYGMDESIAGTYVGAKNTTHESLINYIYDKFGEAESAATKKVYNQLSHGSEQSGAVGRLANYLNAEKLNDYYELSNEQINYLKKVAIISVYDGGKDLEKIVQDLKRNPGIYSQEAYLIMDEMVKKV